VEIGKYAFIGAGSVVTHDVEAYSIVVGNPARHSGWMSENGHRLRFRPDGIAVCPESGSEYLFSGGKVIKIVGNNE
jgi:UDP-2-acetamido-3-amino-2,3-dideoxy-glucuronate N-acetyltransferase